MRKIICALLCIAFVMAAGSVFASAADANLCLGASVADYSGKVNDAQAPECLIDGSAATKWCAKLTNIADTPESNALLASGYQQWITIDLGSAKKIHSYKMIMASVGTDIGHVEWDTQEWALQISDDAAKWTEVDYVSDNTAAEYEKDFGEKSARYIRLLIVLTDIQGSGIVRLPELLVFGDASQAIEKADDNNLCTKSFTSILRSSGDIGSVNETAEKAIDGLRPTHWTARLTNVIDNDENKALAAEGVQHWFILDFGSAKTFDKYTLTSADLEKETYTTKAWKVQISNDAADWTTVSEVADNTLGVAEVSIGVQSARYVRLLVTDADQTASGLLRLCEFAVYETAGSTATTAADITSAKGATITTAPAATSAAATSKSAATTKSPAVSPSTGENTALTAIIAFAFVSAIIAATVKTNEKRKKQ